MRVTLRCGCTRCHENYSLDVEAEVFGLFAVHSRSQTDGAVCPACGVSYGTGREWVVTHIPTGRKLDGALDADLSHGECIAIARQLGVMPGWDFDALPEERTEWAWEAVESAQARVLAETRGAA